MLAKVTQSERGYLAHIERHLYHSLESIWTMLTDSNQFERWFNELLAAEIYEVEFESCPLCCKNNNCCNSQDKSLGNCWCSEEAFPNEIFELVLKQQLRKTCICLDCLVNFKSNNCI